MNMSQPNRPTGNIDLNEVQARLNYELDNFRNGIDVSDGSIERGLNEINKGFDMLSSLGKGLKDKVLCSNLDKHKNHPKCNQIKKYYKKNLEMKSGDPFYTEGKAKDSAEKSADKPVYEKMFAVLSKLNGAPGAAQQLHSARDFGFYENATTPKQKLAAVVSWTNYISNTTAQAKSLGDSGKPLVIAGKEVLAELKAAQAPVGSSSEATRVAQAGNDNVTSDASGAESATEAAETLNHSKTLMAALGKFLKIDTLDKSSVKEALSKKLMSNGGPAEVTQFLKNSMASKNFAENIAKSTKLGSAGEVLKVLQKLSNGLRIKLPENITDKSQADKFAEGIVGSVDKLDKAKVEKQKPFEINTYESKPKAHYDLVREFSSDIPDGKIDQAVMGKLAGKMKKILEEGIAKLQAGELTKELNQLGRALNFTFDASDLKLAAEELIKNKSQIESLIKSTTDSLAKEGKTKAEIQQFNQDVAGAKIEGTDQIVLEKWMQEVDDFEKTTPEYKKWLTGPPTKPYEEFLNEDVIPNLKGLQVMFFQLTRTLGPIFKQLSQLLGGLKGESSEDEPHVALEKAALDKVKGANLEKAGEKLGLSAEEVTENSKGIDFYNQNKDLLESIPNLDIKELNTDGEKGITPAEKIKFLNGLDETQRNDFLKVLNSVKDKPYMQGVLEAGLSIHTINEIYDFEKDMLDAGKTGAIEFKDGKLVINGEAVDVKNGDKIKSVIGKYLKSKNKKITEKENEAHTAKFEFWESLKKSGRIDGSVTEEDIPKELIKGEVGVKSLEFAFSSLLKVEENFWSGYKLTKEDLQNFVEKKNSFHLTGAPFHTNAPNWYEFGGQIVDEKGVARDYKDGETGDYLEVDGTGDNISDHKFVNVKSFFNWLKKQ